MSEKVPPTVDFLAERLRQQNRGLETKELRSKAPETTRCPPRLSLVVWAIL